MKLPVPVFSMLLALAVAPAAHGQSLRFLSPKSVDPIKLLPDPPVADSDEAKAEIGLMLAVQERRTPQQVDRCRSEAQLGMAAFHGVVGPWLTPDRLPRLGELLIQVDRESRFYSNIAKKHFSRKRPFVVEKRIQLAIEPEQTPSYPSGHATRGSLYALILAQLAPDCRSALLERGQEIGWDRVVAGEHFPSDVYAGRVLGRAIGEALSANPKFRDELAAVKAEFDQVRQRKAARWFPSLPAPARPLGDGHRYFEPLLLAQHH